MSGFGPATDADLPFLRACIARFRLDDENLDPAQFILLREEGRIVAFGRIKPYGNGVFELGCVGVVEAARSRGLGKRIVRELIRRFPVPEIYITTDLTGYFEPFGFQKTETAPQPILDKLASVCGRLRCRVVAMRLAKEARRA